jgi:hypothetical protein
LQLGRFARWPYQTKHHRYHALNNPLNIFLTLCSVDIAKALPRLNDQYVYVDEDEHKEGDRKSYKVRLIGMNIYKQMVIHEWGRGESRVEAFTELRTRVEKLGEAKKEDAEAGEEDGRGGRIQEIV